MGALLMGNIRTASGKIAQGPNMSPAELKKLENLVKSGVPINQAMTQVYTTSGNTLADAIDLLNKEIAANGGVASPHLPSSFTPDYVAQLLQLPTQFTSTSEGGQTTTQKYGAGTNQLSQDSGIPTWLLVIIGLILFFMMWQSSPEMTVPPKGSGPSVHRYVP